MFTSFVWIVYKLATLTVWLDPQETNALLDLVSRGTIDLFHQLTENQEKSDAPISLNAEHKSVLVLLNY